MDKAYGQLNNMFCTFSQTKNGKILCVNIGEGKGISLYPYLYNTMYKTWDRQTSVSKDQCLNDVIHWKTHALCVGNTYEPLLDIQTNPGGVRFYSW